ncbi:hypothetical protein T4C_8926 [Trichinella pseudospiralis]|uniref:Uncharacterized protein n=2 Tax=Trichinella pseudospiralis TaxID=6337 RepID=A0A0V1ISW8_TRIPS|nr:hypothetical protein T4C_8926 [Trichinella pseudospiralis]
MALCIRSGKRISRGSKNLIKFPLWAFDICITKCPAYCMQASLQSDNFG